MWVKGRRGPDQGPARKDGTEARLEVVNEERQEKVIRPWAPARQAVARG